MPWVEEVFKRFAGPYYITEPVLTEVAHLTGKDKLIVDALKSGKFLVPEGLEHCHFLRSAARPGCGLKHRPGAFGGLGGDTPPNSQARTPGADACATSPVEML